MTTCADLVEETRRLLFSGQREAINKLSGAINNSVTTITLTYDLASAKQGSVISIDLELMLVWDSNEASKTLTVQRGYLGSTAATHADGSLAYVNSKFPTFSIFQALNDDLSDLCAPSNGLLQVIAVETNYNPVVQGYDITGATQILDILAVRAKIVGPSKDWVPITSYRLDQGADTTVFPSGFSITLFQGGQAGLPIQVTYSAPFTSFTALTTTTAAVGLADTMTDIPPLGAGMRLTGVREIQRNFNESQGDTRRASEVPPNAQLAGYSALARERQRRIRAESNRIASNWPLIRQGI